TSSRCYDNARASMEALDIIYKCKGVQFDEKLALEFIKCIGIYPPGSIVELKGGEVGIVINSNDKNKLKPKVLLVLDNNKNLTQEKVVDLSKASPEKTDLGIKRELTNGSFGIYLEEYIKRGLTIKRATPSAPQQTTL
ncbi:MAG: HD-GYP domain-containing protein, partial [Pseudomonadota bacterium]|nr:HD-GYP domain-containing protein [Pseudomonadota bacterium]